MAKGWNKRRGEKPPPGPSDYHVPSGLGGPRVTIAERLMTADETRETRSKPGPGTYDPPDGRSTMKKSILLQVNPPDARSVNPGPGTYKLPDQFHDFTRDLDPKHAFPLAERKWDMPRGPGPGTYEPVDNMFSRTPSCYTFGTKHAELEDGRGPTSFATYSQFV